MSYLISGVSSYQRRPHEWLKHEYQSRKHKNTNYSKRSFARDLEISSGRLAEYLSQNRRVTIEKGHELAQRLRLNSQDTKNFLYSVEANSILPVANIRSDADTSLIDSITRVSIQELLDIQQENLKSNALADRIEAAILTIPANSQKAIMINTLLQNFCEIVSEFLAEEPCDEVYQFHFRMFPLTQKTGLNQNK